MMQKQIELVLTPQEAFDPELFAKTVSDQLHIASDDDRSFRLLRRSIDARSRNAVVKVLVEMVSKEERSVSRFRITGITRTFPTPGR